jgi:hypothetical protein
MKILLVEPNFPISTKSKNHSDFLPIGLLKIASYHKSLGDTICLNRGNLPSKFVPDEIKITSLFTYWSKYVKESVNYYKKLYPESKIEVGGIYASLMPEHCKEYTGCDKVYTGLYRNGKAEEYEPDYSLVNVDYQIIHASRGCFRHCNFCGTWKIEPEVTYKKTILKEIRSNKLIFYDNNLLANPNIKLILKEIENSKINDRVVFCESQSGLDGRILEKDPELAISLKKARFLKPRIAWDGSIKLKEKIKNQVEILKNAGYRNQDIYVFMLYNHNSLDYKEMCEKLEECRKWGVQVVDCRYRPLNATEDNYKPRAKSQTSKEYFIASNWTDNQIRSFRKAVRRQNIAIRLNLPEYRYIDGVEKKYVSCNLYQK